MKTAVFFLRAVRAGASGVFSGHLTRNISPAVYSFSRVVDILAFAIFGGTTNWVGPIVGASILTAIPERARPLKAFNQLFNGIVLLTVMVYLPDGIIDPKLLQRIAGKFKSRKRDEP